MDEPVLFIQKFLCRTFWPVREVASRVGLKLSLTCGTTNRCRAVFPARTHPGSWAPDWKVLSLGMQCLCSSDEHVTSPSKGDSPWLLGEDGGHCLGRYPQCSPSCWKEETSFAHILPRSTLTGLPEMNPLCPVTISQGQLVVWRGLRWEMNRAGGTELILLRSSSVSD